MPKDITTALSVPTSCPWPAGPSLQALGQQVRPSGVWGMGLREEERTSRHFQPLVLPCPWGLSPWPCGQEQRSALTSSPGQSPPLSPGSPTAAITLL